MRVARIAGLVSLTLIGAFMTAVPASAASVSISKFKVAPAYASGGGSSVKFTAKTKHATSCRIKSSPDVKGMPAAVKCSSGSLRKLFKVPANTSTKARAIVFTLIARHGSLKVSAHVTVHQDPALATITSLTRSPATAQTDSATSVKVNAKVTRAKTCTLSASPAVSGLPASAACTSGSFAKTVSIPANPTASARTFTLTLAAKNSIGVSTKKSVKVTQPAETSAPTVAVAPTPGALTAGGGALTLKTTVAHATTCTFTSSPSVGPLSCANGTVNHAVSIPANTSGASKSYTFTLSATNPLGTATTVLSMTQPTQAPAPIQFVSISSSPVSLTAAGGSFTVKARLSGASTCSLTSTPDVGSATNVSCSNGTFNTLVSIPTNTTASVKPYHFDLSATGEGGSATAGVDISQPAAPVPPPVVTAINSNPTTLTTLGGPVTVTATLSGASSCTWSSSPNTGSAASAACSGSSSNPFVVPANSGNSAITYTFTVDVVGADGGHASATLTLTQPAASPSGPQVTSITPSPPSLTSDGGSLNVAATVTNAGTCSVTSSPDIGSITGAVCTGGNVSKAFTVPPNATGADRQYTFTITAKAASGAATATGTLKMTEPAATPPGPQVVSMTTNPTTIGYQGGNPTVSATVTNATSCTLGVGGDGGATVTAGASGSCTSGTYTGTVHIPQNNGPGTKTVTITVGVTGSGRTASGTLTFHVPPPPPTVTNLSATIPASGGTVAVTATLSGVDGSSTCDLSSTPSVTGTGSQSCTTTSYSRNVSIPANTSGATKVYKFQLDVTAPGGTATASVNVNQASS